MRTEDPATAHKRLATFALNIGRRDQILGVLVVALSIAAVFGRAIGLSKVLVFVIGGAALAILAYGIGVATDELGSTAGPRVSGILNATFGNIAELVIAGFALRAGLLEIVRASIAGSVLGNTLLVLGLCMFVGGWRHGVQRFSRVAASMNGTLLLLAATGLIAPALLLTTGVAIDGGKEQHLSIVVSLVLLVVYLASLRFYLTTPEAGGAERASEPAHWGWGSATIILGVLALVTAPVADAFVAVLEPTAKTLGLPELFLGLVIVPLVGNIPENLVGLTVAWRGDMDFAMVIALGSSLQVALMVGPVLALLSPLLGHRMTLVFAPVEIVAIAAGVLITAIVSVDGESTWIEGLALIAVYIIFAAAIYVWPIGAL
ncbi:MAG: calcium/proton exchanger, partial [Chloroflexota bacterium]|nr:calcium/proton exchanger [Chloroflexota bacterium]